jgi:hypothetical protein
MVWFSVCSVLRVAPNFATEVESARTCVLPGTDFFVPSLQILSPLLIVQLVRDGELLVTTAAEAMIRTERKHVARKSGVLKFGFTAKY